MACTNCSPCNVSQIDYTSTCPGGCIPGAGTVQPPEKSRRLLEQYKAQAPKSNPVESDYTEYLQIIREDEENWDPVARH